MTQGFDEWRLSENDKLEFLNLPVVKSNLANCWFDDQNLIMPSGQGRTLKAAVYSALEVFKIVKASRQAEIDGLNALSEMSEQKIDDLVLRNIELQKLIDKALKTIEIQQRFLGDADGANKFLTSQVEELQKKYDAMYKAFTVSDDARKEWHRCYMGIRQREDELQKRIDEALLYIRDNDNFGLRCMSDVKGILKGKKDE